MNTPTPGDLSARLNHCDAPCGFCGYKGAGYWQRGTHALDCPWYDVGGMVERRRIVARIAALSALPVPPGYTTDKDGSIVPGSVYDGDERYDTLPAAGGAVPSARQWLTENEQVATSEWKAGWDACRVEYPRIVATNDCQKCGESTEAGDGHMGAYCPLVDPEPGELLIPPTTPQPSAAEDAAVGARGEGLPTCLRHDQIAAVRYYDSQGRRCTAFKTGQEIGDALSTAPAAGKEEISPEFTDSARAAIAWVLYHHQGGNSAIGQPLRFALGMGNHEPLPEWRIAEAKAWAEVCGETENFRREAALTRQPVAGDGMVLVPRVMSVDEDAWRAASFVIGSRDDWRKPWRLWYRKYDCRACKVSIRLVRDGDSGEGE